MKDKKINSIVWGVALIIVGCLFAMDRLDLMRFNPFFEGWWTLFIIIPCAIGLFRGKDKEGNIIGLIIGGVLLCCAQNWLSFDLVGKLFFPVIILAIGIKMLYKGLKKNENTVKIENLNKDGLPSSCAIFGGVDMKPQNEIFNGVELTAVFGGVECDLRNAIIQEDCVIVAAAVFGGIDIFLPENVNVKVDSNSLFGCVSDKKHHNKQENTVTVYVKGTAMFGGIEIK